MSLPSGKDDLLLVAAGEGVGRHVQRICLDTQPVKKYLHGSAFVRAACGFDPVSGGTVTICGEELRPLNIKNAIGHGLVMASEDRRKYGIRRSDSCCVRDEVGSSMITIFALW